MSRLIAEIAICTAPRPHTLGQTGQCGIGFEFAQTSVLRH